MSKQKLQGDDYEIMVDTTDPNKNSQSVVNNYNETVNWDFLQKNPINKIELYKVKDIIIDGEKPIAYIKIGGYGVAIDKKSVEELIEASKTILKKK